MYYLFLLFTFLIAYMCGKYVENKYASIIYAFYSTVVLYCFMFRSL